MAYLTPPRPGQRRIALLHAIPISIEPIRAAFAAEWPEAWTTNLLDDALLAARSDGFTPDFLRRFAAICRYMADTGVEAILCTGSAFGPAVEAARREIALPILKPYEAMIEEGLEAGRRIGMVATYPLTVELLRDDIEATARARGKPVEIVARLAAGGMEALDAGRPEEHDRLVAQAAAELADCDVILLAQYSMARAAPRVAHRRVLTAPESAVRKLRGMLRG